MPHSKLTQFLLLPKLRLVEFGNITRNKVVIFHCETNSTSDFCPHCGLETFRIHDHRVVTIIDAPHAAKKKILKIKKKRFRCEGLHCKKVFTESINGIQKRGRVTERMKRHLLYVCDKFANMKAVKKHTKLATGTIYKKHYEQLELEWRKRKNNPWPKTIGIDEHSFQRNKEYGHMEFATIVVDYTNKRVKELIPGRVNAQLQQALAYIPGRENVKNVVCDLSKPYRNFAKDFFPNAKVIADHFHVVRLLNPHINRARKEVTGDKRNLRIRKLLLMNSRRLDYWTRSEIHKWLKQYPKLEQLYLAKEALHKMYRCKGRKRAKKSLGLLLDTLACSQFKELKSLRRTLMDWKDEILNYFESRITNARTEGYNNVCKQLQKRAYGYKSFKNYRLKVLYACT